MWSSIVSKRAQGAKLKQTNDCIRQASNLINVTKNGTICVMRGIKQILIELFPVIYSVISRDSHPITITSLRQSEPELLFVQLCYR